MPIPDDRANHRDILRYLFSLVRMFPQPSAAPGVAVSRDDGGAQLRVDAWTEMKKRGGRSGFFMPTSFSCLFMPRFVDQNEQDRVNTL